MNATEMPRSERWRGRAAAAAAAAGGGDDGKGISASLSADWSMALPGQS